MGEARIKERVRAKLVSEISQAELACRIFERVSGIEVGLRPFPTSPEKSMEVVKAEDPVMFARLMAAAEAAMGYVVECINKGAVPS